MTITTEEAEALAESIWGASEMERAAAANAIRALAAERDKLSKALAGALANLADASRARGEAEGKLAAFVEEWKRKVERVEADAMSLAQDTSSQIAALRTCLATARNDALEEAARVADGYHEAAIKWAATYVKQFDGETDSKRIAAAIRALKSETKP